ncbi:MAG: RHS repeat-associated core domain-containing protein [Saprospiraceae bacterium]
MNEDLGLNWSDYGARWYDASVGRFHVIDRFAEKYYDMTTYQYGANNPIGNIDINWDSVIVVIDKEGAGGNGHMAMFFQNKNGEWNYFSQGAMGMPSSGELGLVSSSDTEGGVTIVPMRNKDGSAMSIKEVLSVAGSGVLGTVYDDAELIPTSRDEDEKITKGAESVRSDHASGKSEYSLFTNNCVDACQSAIQKNTTISTPLDINPKPNSYFNKLRKKGVTRNTPRPKSPQVDNPGSRLPSIKY